jgi:hypothetical protein
MTSEKKSEKLWRNFVYHAIASIAPPRYVVPYKFPKTVLDYASKWLSTVSSNSEFLKN